MNGWLLFPTALLVIGIGAGIFNIVFNCIDFWHAALREREDAQADGERGAS